MAMFKDVINLISVTITKDALKQEIETKTEREVFANKRSIAQSEFFNAGQTGIKAEQLFEIRSVDYAEERLLSFNNKEYSVYRTYEKGENIELYCEVRIGGN
jgi:SPP1 family predicted phage head-tail adaptor